MAGDTRAAAVRRLRGLAGARARRRHHVCVSGPRAQPCAGAGAGAGGLPAAALRTVDAARRAVRRACPARVTRVTLRNAIGPPFHHAGGPGLGTGGPHLRLRWTGHGGATVSICAHHAGRGTRGGHSCCQFQPQEWSSVSIMTHDGGAAAAIGIRCGSRHVHVMWCGAPRFCGCIYMYIYT